MIGVGEWVDIHPCTKIKPGINMHCVYSQISHTHTHTHAHTHTRTQRSFLAYNNKCVCVCLRACVCVCVCVCASVCVCVCGGVLCTCECIYTCVCVYLPGCYCPGACGQQLKYFSDPVTVSLHALACTDRRDPGGRADAYASLSKVIPLIPRVSQSLPHPSV